MPTYQYACRDCGHAFEQVQSFSDAALTRCPACQGSLRKVFSAVGVVFKGSGFYRNDSRTPAKAAEGSAGPVEGGTKTEAAPKGDGGAKGDAKPAPAAAGASSASAKPGGSSGGGGAKPSSTAGNAA